MRKLLTVALCLGTLHAGAQVKPDLAAGEPSSSQNLALKLYERLAGLKAPIDSPTVQQMAAEIQKGNLGGAADIAMADPNFYNITIKHMALKRSTREETLKIPFNDFAASWIGIVRDNLDGRTLLTGNFVYVADPAKLPMGVTIASDVLVDTIESNNHYQQLEQNNVNLAAVLVKRDGQMVSNNANPAMAIPNPDPAGVVTSRAFMTAHAIAGTNRRPVEFLFREFMCSEIQEWADTGAPDLRIGPDIERYPGGDNKKFETSCKGCHTQMDSFRGAFAFWDSDGNRAVFTPGRVSGKYTRNQQVFPDGYVYRDNSFINNSNRATNATTFGWRSTNTYGNGVGQLGKMVSESRRFSECMTRVVFETSCKREFNITTNLSIIKKYAPGFEASGYNFKSLFRTVATSPECIGE